MKLHRECRADGCTEPLVSQSEHVTGFCFKCGDGEYHGEDDGTPRRSDKWKSYIGEINEQI